MITTNKKKVQSSNLDSFLTAIDLTADADLSNDSITSLQRQIEIARQCDSAKEFVAKAREIKGVPMELSEWFYNRYNSTGMVSIEKTAEEFLSEVKS